jgi:radical SAM protein with 4Fe4S-binding SPASM domain
MVRIARDANVADRIWTKTNGSLLGPEVNEQLVTSGLDMIHISIEQVSVEGYERVAKVRLDYEKLKTNIADLYARRGDMKLTIKMADSGVSEDESKRFFDEFGPISDFIGIEKLFQWSYGGLKDFQMGTTPDTYDGLPLVNKIACAFPLYVLAVNADGSVSVCCNDWAYKTSVGRVGDRTLMEIWNSDELHEFRKMHLEGRRAANRACADCYYLRTAPDNIDAHRMTILERLENSRGTLRD